MAWQSLVAGVITGLMSVTGLISVAGILMDGPRFRAWERGWLLMARGILTGLWRSVRPFASSVPSFGRQRRSQRLVLLREQRDFSEVMLDAHRLLAETQHRVSLSGEVCSRCGDRPPSSRERSTCYDCQVEVMKGGLLAGFGVPQPLLGALCDVGYASLEHVEFPGRAHHVISEDRDVCPACDVLAQRCFPAPEGD